MAPVGRMVSPLGNTRPEGVVGSISLLPDHSKSIIMKKIFLLLLFSQQLLTHAQNVGIGTTNPTRAKLEVHGAVDATSAIFGADGTGISLQRSWPGIGFNQYYNGGSKYIGNGFAAVQFLDPTSGYMSIDMISSGSANNAVGAVRRALVISPDGRVNICGAGAPYANLNVSRGSNIGTHYATAAFEGNQYHSFFNYGVEEHTYIRAGRNGSTVFINDIPNGITAIGGKVGIGTATPAYALEIRQPGVYPVLGLIHGTTFKDWNFTINGTSGALELGFGIYQVGRFDTDGDYNSLSDSRVKTNVHALPALLDKVMQLQPVNYEMIHNNPDHKQRIGFLAQNVKKIFPELVSVRTDTTGYKDITDLHMLSYSGFGVLAIKAIQEQQVIINQQQQAIQNMQQLLEELKQTVKEMSRQKVVDQSRLPSNF
jgi:hypothetical protein